MGFITNFNGDFSELAAMMRVTWAANHEQPLRYSCDFLRNMFSYPGSNFDLAPAIYRNSALVGFIAGFPRRIRVEGQDLCILLNTFLSVSPDHQAAGLGIHLWTELSKRARKEGYDGMIGFCVEGDQMNRMVLQIARRSHLPTSRVFSVGYLGLMLSPSVPGNPSDASSKSIDLEAFLKTAAAAGEIASLTRRWTKEEAEWQCATRHQAVVLEHSIQSRSGFITGYIMEVERTEVMPVLIVEDLLWGDLEASERVSMTKRFLDRATALRVRTILCPNLGYADLRPLTAAGFMRTRRILHMYLTLWNGALPAEPYKSVYLDVL
jgi:GNAT superfamily N-acetyltransferase